MSVARHLAFLEGRWKGINRLNLPWLPEPVRESESEALVLSRIGCQCLEISYTWNYEGTAQDGLLLLTVAPEGNDVSAFWTDSWHSANTLMPCNGSISDDGVVDIKGSYSVPDNPDWGWRTKILPVNSGFRYLMFNVTPEGEEVWAVETEFSRS